MKLLRWKFSALIEEYAKGVDFFRRSSFFARRQ
jgi:hypothetical protein